MTHFTSQLIDDEFEKRIHELNECLISKQDINYPDTLFYFNPNKVTDSELVKLGFSNYQRKSFLGYRNKIGDFKSKEDLLKVYGVDSLLMSKIEDYILFPKNISVKSKQKASSIQWINFNKVGDEFWDYHISSSKMRDSIYKILSNHKIKKSLPLEKIQTYSNSQLIQWLNNNKEEKDVSKGILKSIIKINLNTADTTRLKQLKGVGSILSNRIVKFRNLLGGYCDVAQVKEVYGFSEELYLEVKKYVYVDISFVVKLDPGKDKISAFVHHPYFSYDQSKELFNLYRKTKKPTISDISILPSVKEEDLERMKMYLLIYDRENKAIED